MLSEEDGAGEWKRKVERKKRTTGPEWVSLRRELGRGVLSEGGGGDGVVVVVQNESQVTVIPAQEAGIQCSLEDTSWRRRMVSMG